MTSRRSASSPWVASLLTVTGIWFSALSVFSCGAHAQSDPGIVQVRDRLYVWTHPAGSHDGYYLAPHTHVQSRMTPVEGARYLGVPNLYFIQYKDDSPLPSEFRKYAISFSSPVSISIAAIQSLRGEPRNMVPAITIGS